MKLSGSDGCYEREDYKPSRKWLDGGEMLAEPTRTSEKN